MGTGRKITIEVPPELLEKAQRASGAGIAQTVRTGLQLVAASHAYTRLRQIRGHVRFSRTLAELKADRRSRPTPAPGSHSCKATAARTRTCSTGRSGTGKC
jgi:hypothetical protein